MIRLVFTILIILFSFPLHGQKLYAETGKASYYAKKFEGRKTASGERFSNEKLTAAHRTLPFGTYVKVTNLKNNKSIIVKINDRGPYIHGRIIDLSRVAADSLDFIRSGWTTVKVEEIKIPEPEIVVTPVDNEPVFSFPAAWIGDWKGEFKIYDRRGFRTIIPMEMHIHPSGVPDRYSWVIVYDTSERNYELVVRDSVKNIFSIDEKNGIDIMGYRLGNNFICRFEVEGQLLDCEYSLRNADELTFRIHAGDHTHHWSTGGIQTGNDSIPRVQVYPLSVLQYATLYRVKK